MSVVKPSKIPAKPAKPAKDTVYVDVDDDITAIITKVEASKNKVVALVLPKRSTALQSIVNMRLLKRNADNAEKNVVLITSEESLLPLAGAAGIHVAKNLQSMPGIPPSPSKIEEQPEPTNALDEKVPEKPAKIDYNRSAGELATAKTVDEPETIALEDEDETSAKAADGAGEHTPKDKKLKIPNFEKFRILIVLGAVGFIGLVTFIILALFVWPHATIAIQTESMPVSTSFTLTATDAAKKLDETKDIIPAILKSSSQTSSSQVQATGQQNNGKKASGTIKLSLTDCSQSQVTIPAGTGVSSGGLVFITQSSVTLQSVLVGDQCKNGDFPGFSTASVNIVAQVGGAKYNLAASSSFDVGLSNVTGTSSGAITGGTDDITIVVSQQDLDNAKKSATSGQSATDFTNKFQKDLGDEGFYVISATLKPADPVVTSTPGVGQPAGKVSVNIKVTYSVLVVQKPDLEKIVLGKLNKQIDQNRQRFIDDDMLKDLSINVQSQGSPHNATLSVSKQAAAIPILDEPAIKKQSSGQKSGNIISTISDMQGVKNVEVRMSPFWVSKAPSPGKITIVLQQASN